MANGSEIVRLNIGGKRFYTTRSTLLSHNPEENFFSALLSGRFEVPKDEKGFYFIDRNGRYFEPILDYLRTSIWNPPEDLNHKALLEETRFYGIEPEDYTTVTDSSLEEKINSTSMYKFEEALATDGVKDLASFICKQFWQAAERGLPVRTPYILPSKETLMQLIKTHGGGADWTLETTEDTHCVYSDVYHSAIQNLGIQHLIDCLAACFKISVEIDDVEGSIEKSGITLMEKSHRLRRRSHWMVTIYIISWVHQRKQTPQVSHLYSPPRDFDSQH
eukprot:TRINITY_DN6602_c0_g3_i1.p1 TRINITY_DN6602_c0_g3~~TRINITY_DN6602_c0_g3_i1.p1  ORF type:complete len:294 (-),score=39.98 TRINITY_DN6602_c0_g3_i1:102-929(-)